MASSRAQGVMDRIRAAAAKRAEPPKPVVKIDEETGEEIVIKRTRRKKAAVRTDARDWGADFADGGAHDNPLDAEILDSMRSFIDYTLTDRALPYVDGLKPVHRAVIWDMWKGGHKSSANHVKSQSIAGDTIAKYHPHSADAVYLASAGLTRSRADDTRCGACKLNLSLIDGRGNFGSSFEDSPAAPRYTEQRLSRSGESCVRDTTDGAVFMEPTFDAKNSIPEMMPVRIPLLLINGSDGLAYGYNVNWMPHNPSEAIRACILRIDDPGCSVGDVMSVMPGPDFPSGGVAVDRAEGGIADGIGTGFGSFLLTSRYEINEGPRGRHLIDVYETPFGVARSGGDESARKAQSIVTGVTKYATDHPQCGITDVKNLSGKDNDCLIEISVKAGVDAAALARRLADPASGTRLTETMSYRQSAVIGSFEPSPVPDNEGREGVLRLCDERPRDVGVIGYIDAFLDFRRACVKNSASYEMGKALARKHLLDGMLASVADIDAVISIVRQSEDKDAAAAGLMKAFKIDREQADYVLAIPLARLTRADGVRLFNECSELEATADRCAALLSDPSLVDAEIRSQLEEELARQSLPRRTTIVGADGKVVAAAAADDKARVAMAEAGAVAAADPRAAEEQAASEPEPMGEAACYLMADGSVMRLAKGKAPAHIREVRFPEATSWALLVFENGDSIRMRAYEIPERPAVIGKRAVGLVDLGDMSEKTDVAMVSSSGRVKVLDTSTLTKSTECPVMRLGAGERVLTAAKADGMVFSIVTSDAQLLTFPCDGVTPQGRTSAGMAGMKVRDGSRVVAAALTPAETDAVVVTSTGSTAKASMLSEFPQKGRGTGGVRCQRLLKGEAGISFAFVAPGAVAVDARGVDVRLEIRRRDDSGEKVEIAGARVKR